METAEATQAAAALAARTDQARISRATVKTHVSSILTKLGLTSRLQIAVWAFENGLAGVGDVGGPDEPDELRQRLLVKLGPADPIAAI